MELTNWQTRQINNFLESIDVAYIDIRYEMIDHIATEIEENVEDIDTFFEHKGFQTQFLKYMLSKKDALKDKYKRIVKRRFWADFKLICKNILREFIKIKNVIFLSFFLAITYSFTLILFNIQNKNSLEFCLF